MVAARSGLFPLKKNRGLGLPVAAVIRLFRVNQPSFPVPGTQGHLSRSLRSLPFSVFIFSFQFRTDAPAFNEAVGSQPALYRKPCGDSGFLRPNPRIRRCLKMKTEN
jgi:hypothetical protein